MPSLQSRLLSAFLRRTFKVGTRLPLPVPFVRAAVEAPARLAHLALPEPERSRVVLHGEWLEPEGAVDDAVLLFLHGGGYFFGSPRTHRTLTSALARYSRMAVLALDYRLAPEHPFPAALEDAVAACRALQQEGRRVFLAGDSAGGGLALATMLTLRDAGLPLPAAAALFSPWTDLAGTGESLGARTCAMFHGQSLHRAVGFYLAGQDPRHPLVSPLYGDLQGLPPLLVHVSATEVLLDDSTRLADRAREAGVPVQLRVFRDQPHVWQIYARLLPEARESLREAAHFLHQHLEPRPKAH